MGSDGKEMNMSEKTDCPICCETVSVSSMIKCSFCEHKTCNVCFKTYLMTLNDENPKCMNCNKIWSLDFVASNSPSSFHNIKYRNRRAQIVFEKEQAKLPIFQNLAKLHIFRKEKESKISELEYENKILRSMIRANVKKIENIRMEINNPENKSEKRVFTCKCPVNDCRGYLDKDYNCGTCNTWICRKCNEPKKDQKDPDHKCDPELEETVKLIKRDTKPCPSCGERIYKTEGCDQMYCTMCHTAFSWTSGKVETGVIHNPHFYEFQREMNGGVAPRVAGDLPCGGMPSQFAVSSIVESAFGYSTPPIDVFTIHRLQAHIQYVEIPRYPDILHARDNDDLGVKYLMKEIDQKKWKSELKRRQKRKEKDGEINQILTMFNASIVSIFGNIVSDTYNVPVYLVSLEKLREYTNDQLGKISDRYKNKAPSISDKWEFIR